MSPAGFELACMVDRVAPLVKHDSDIHLFEHQCGEERIVVLPATCSEYQESASLIHVDHCGGGHCSAARMRANTVYKWARCAVRKTFLSHRTEELVLPLVVLTRYTPL